MAGIPKVGFIYETQILIIYYHTLHRTVLPQVSGMEEKVAL